MRGRSRIQPEAAHDVGEIDPARLDPYAQLACGRLRIVRLLEFKNFGRAGLRNPDLPHLNLSPEENPEGHRGRQRRNDAVGTCAWQERRGLGQDRENTAGLPVLSLLHAFIRPCSAQKRPCSRSEDCGGARPHGSCKRCMASKFHPKRLSPPTRLASLWGSESRAPAGIHCVCHRDKRSRRRGGQEVIEPFAPLVSETWHSDLP